MTHFLELSAYDVMRLHERREAKVMCRREAMRFLFLLPQRPSQLERWAFLKPPAT